MLSTLKFILDHPLNRQQKLSAIRRWVNWQVGSRLVPGPVAVKFVNDSVLLVSPGMTGATGNVYAGLHEFEDMAFALHLLRRDELFVDVGANIGSYTVLAASVGAQVMAIEPIAETFRHLVRNIQINDMTDRVDARQLGVGAQTETRKFTSGLDTVNHAVNGGEENGTAVCEVKVETLDKIVGDAQPVLLKVDVEGLETEVIDGAANVLSKDSLVAVIMELNGSGRRYNYDDNELYQRMLSTGFTACSYSPFERSLMALNHRPESGNTIFVRNFDAVGQRLKDAATFTANSTTV